MLLATFGTLMSSLGLEALMRIAGEGKYNTRANCLGAHKVTGWRFDYVANNESWNPKVRPDISKDTSENIWAVVYDIPTRTLNYLCEGQGIYSNQCRFDHLNIDGLGREATVIRLAQSQPYSKPSVPLVLSIAHSALSARVDESYVYNVVIGRAGLDHGDAEQIYDEQMYSNRVGKAGELMRDWYSQNVHYQNRSG